MEFLDCNRLVSQGVARVSLKSISFFLGGIDENIVLRRKETNYISALIDDHRVHEALREATLNRGTLLKTSNNEECPLLTFPTDSTLYEL